MITKKKKKKLEPSSALTGTLWFLQLPENPQKTKRLGSPAVRRCLPSDESEASGGNPGRGDVEMKRGREAKSQSLRHLRKFAD